MNQFIIPLTGQKCKDFFLFGYKKAAPFNGRRLLKQLILLF